MYNFVLNSETGCHNKKGGRKRGMFSLKLPAASIFKGLLIDGHLVTATRTCELVLKSGVIIWWVLICQFVSYICVF